MNKKQMLCVALLLTFCLGFAWAEETELVPQGTLRLTLAPSYGFQTQEWEGFEAEKVKAASIGLGFEYSVTSWLCAQAFWVPGYNVWSSMEDGGELGPFSDAFFGLKIGLVGEYFPIEREDMRLAVAAGIKIPTPSSGSSTLEGDRHLWGSVLRLYFDYIFNPVFYLNLFAEAVYYPDQQYTGPNYSGRTVYHPLDLNFELDLRYTYDVGNGVLLHWGLPLNFFAAPWINLNDAYAEGTELRFSPGVFFTALFTQPRVPFDISVRYTAPVWGRYVQPVHRVALTGRLYFRI